MSAPTAKETAKQDGAASTAPARVAFERTETGELRAILSGNWRIGRPRPEPHAIARELEHHPAQRILLDARGIAAWDTALLAWLRAAIHACAAGQVEFDRSGLPDGVVALLDLAERVVEPARPPARAPESILARIGARAAEVAEETKDALRFLGTSASPCRGSSADARRCAEGTWWHFVQSAGAEALPIVTLISVIVGLILAFVGAVQLRLFGADIYVANLVGVAMVREMGAMMVGIIMAGRTGAAYAAQLGTMKVTGEIDALTTFGISAVDFLVVPRVVAMFLMMPILCLYSVVLGCVGGAMVGVGMLGISPRLYLDQTLDSLELVDLNGGLFHGCVYGFLIGITGCLRGMQSGRDAAAVGDATTSAVVTSIVAIIVADGILAVLFNALGI